MKKIGDNIQLNIEGTSHSKKIEFSLKGIKKGEMISLDKINHILSRRSSMNKDYATQRKEKDEFILISGIENGLATGEVIKGYFNNKDTKSSDYKNFNLTPRPGHIDYVAIKKHGEAFDLSGSSYYSGRMSVAIVFAGSIAKQILENRGIVIGSHLLEVYGIMDESFDPVNLSSETLKNLDVNLPFINSDISQKVLNLVEKFRAEEDSFGGTIQVGVVGDLGFIGDAYFDRLQSKIASYVLSTPGTKGIEFGNGFAATKLKGSENNDKYIIEANTIKTKTNNCGGINGGIANGMPIIFNVGVKPTSSISQGQSTVNIKTKQVVNLKVEGRHDPAFILRVAPVIEAMTSLALLDLIYKDSNDTIRDKIDSIDEKMIDLYIQRMDLTDRVGVIKEQENREILDLKREEAILNSLANYPDYQTELNELYESILKQSKLRQKKIFYKKRASYGLIGRKLGYSFSKEIHEKFKKYDYDLIELKPEELSEFLEQPKLKGLNVTIPYKKAVVPYLDSLSNEAKMIGVVNTIKFECGKKLGFNTDFYGFKKLLINKKIYVKGKNILVLGSGATSTTVKAVLENMGASKVTFVSRSGDINYETIYDYQDYQVLINTTPVGMNSNSNDLLVDLDRLPNLIAVCDVVYNPIYSRLIIEAKKRGLQTASGIDMLIYQAKKSFEIFTNSKISESKARKLRNDILFSKMNIVLVGMPGSGKTTIGRNLAKLVNKQHVDLDDEFFNHFGVRPAQIIESQGEMKFREMESEVAKKFGSMNNLVISTGGGVVTVEENYHYLKKNALIIEIERDIKKLSTRNRPLSQGGIKTLHEMKKKRISKYELFADTKIVNNGYFRNAVSAIMEMLEDQITRM